MSGLRPIARRLFRAAVPPLLADGIRALRHRPVFRGDYSNWAAAAGATTGYDQAEILQRVLAATRTVRDGGAAYERDSVLFDAPDDQWPVLSALLRVAALNAGRLHLVDFGGALGSTWWQHRRWFAGLDIAWCIVEQPAFVEAGRREFGSPLAFYSSLEAVAAEREVSAILLSSVLPYLEHPRDLLADIARRRMRHVIIDRTGFTRNGRDRLTVQHVPPSIYPASYPCWFFDEPTLLAALGSEYRVIGTWTGPDRADIEADYRGIYLERTS